MCCLHILDNIREAEESAAKRSFSVLKVWDLMIFH